MASDTCQSFSRIFKSAQAAIHQTGRRFTMKRIITLAIAAAFSAATFAADMPDTKATYADIEATFGSVPTFLKVFPAVGIAGAWNEMKSLQMNPHTALSNKEK